MPTMTMSVQSIEPPGKTRRAIVGIDLATNREARVGAFAEKIGLFQVGNTYQIEYEEKPFDGRTLRNVKSATSVGAPSPRIATPTAAPSAARPGGNQQGSELRENLSYNRQTSPVDAKRMFVCANLTAFIRAGKVDLEPGSLAAATNMLQRLWDYAFESERGTFTSGVYRQTARR